MQSVEDGVELGMTMRRPSRGEVPLDVRIRLDLDYGADKEANDCARHLVGKDDVVVGWKANGLAPIRHDKRRIGEMTVERLVMVTFGSHIV